MQHSQEQIYVPERLKQYPTITVSNDSIISAVYFSLRCDSWQRWVRMGAEHECVTVGLVGVSHSGGHTCCCECCVWWDTSLSVKKNMASVCTWQQSWRSLAIWKVGARLNKHSFILLFVSLPPDCGWKSFISRPSPLWESYRSAAHERFSIWVHH